MRSHRTIDLFNYWNGLRGARPAPTRAEIEPADIKTLLADTFILERGGRGEASFRLAGTRLCATFGRELKGFSFASLWRPADQALAAKMAAAAFDASSVVVMLFQGTDRRSRFCRFELLMLPLSGGTQAPRCLGLMTAPEPPFWLGTDAITECAVESVRLVDPDREPLFLANRPAIPVPPLAPAAADLMPVVAASDAAGSHILAPIARPQASQLNRPPQGRRVRHLLVLEGGLSLGEG